VTITIRLERPEDVPEIHAVTEAAFRGRPYSDGSEPGILDRLRRDGDLRLSLVAEEDGEVVGHIAFSPVSISDGAQDWYGLGPVSVRPDKQGRGTGAQLIQHGLAELRNRKACGVVLLGNPKYYGRFGFVHDPALSYPGPPAEYFQRLVLMGDAPAGEVRYAPAFG
jgi:putative acetyltransferase